MNVAMFDSKPDEVMIMRLPNGLADVWIRKNIVEKESEDGAYWEADEKYLRTSLPDETIRERVDLLFENGAPKDEVVTADPALPTLEERMDAVEAAIIDLAEVIING